MKTRATIGPFVTLVLTLAVQRADKALQISHAPSERVANSLRLARVLAASRTLSASGDDRRQGTGAPECCRQFRYSSS